MDSEEIFKAEILEKEKFCISRYDSAIEKVIENLIKTIIKFISKGSKNI